MACFRPAELTDIKLYKEQLGEGFAGKAADYMRSAAACRTSNGDSASAQRTLFPMVLYALAGFEFGFITGLGTERTSNSSLIHGYAATDPKIGGKAQGLEFIYMITDAPTYSPTTERKTVGEWVIHVDDSKDFDDHFNREARRAKVRIDGTSYELVRDIVRSVSQSEKIALAEEIQHMLARSLEDEGFELLSDADLQAEAGFSSAELLKQIASRQPFGMRNFSAKFGPTLLALLNDKRPTCTDDGEGAMMALLTAIQPVPEVASDYGSVDVVIIAAGACARASTASTRTYISGLIEEATAQLLTLLKNR